MAGGASSQVNEDDESEINVLAYDGSHRQYSAENMGVQEIHISVIWKMVHAFLSLIHKFSKMHALGAS
jgi:hypothetical protein